MPVLARWWNQRGETLDELQGREDELSAPIGTGFWQGVDQPVGIELLQALGGERSAGAIAQQPFQPAPVVGGDAYRGVQGEPAAVVPPRHLLAVVFVDQPAPNKCAQDATTNPTLYGLGVACIQLVNREETDPPLQIGHEYAVDDADMKVRVQVERGAEAVNEGKVSRWFCTARYGGVSVGRRRR